MKKFVYFAILTLVSLSLFADDPYSQEAERKAIKGAYNILKVYYPSPDDLCVSDTIYPKDLWRFSGHVDLETERAFRLDAVSDKDYNVPIAISKTLSTLFKTDSCMCHHYKYVADFSVPFKYSIMCEIMPSDRRIGIYGAPRIRIFFFRYNKKGEIIQMNNDILHVD